MSNNQNVPEGASLAETTDMKSEEVNEINMCDTETGECVAVSIEETVKETVAVVTEVVSEVHETLIEDSEAAQLEEVVVEPSLSFVETEVKLIPPSSESSTSCSSPIEISNSAR